MKQLKKNDKTIIKISFTDQETLRQYRSKFEAPALFTAPEPVPPKTESPEKIEQLKSPTTLTIKKEGSSTSKKSGRKAGSPMKRKVSASSTPTRRIEKALRVDSPSVKRGASLPKTRQEMIKY